MFNAMRPRKREPPSPCPPCSLPPHHRRAAAIPLLPPSSAAAATAPWWWEAGRRHRSASINKSVRSCSSRPPHQRRRRPLTLAAFAWSSRALKCWLCPGARQSRPRGPCCCQLRRRARNLGSEARQPLPPFPEGRRNSRRRSPFQGPWINALCDRIVELILCRAWPCDLKDAAGFHPDPVSNTLDRIRQRPMCAHTILIAHETI